MSREQYFHVENHPQVYADAAAVWQNPQRALAYHRILGKVIRPNTHFAPGVEERLGEEIEDGAQCAIAGTHGSLIDPLTVAAWAEHTPALHPLRGNTMIGAKVSLFTTPIIGKLVPDLGALPVWRRKDVVDPKQSAEEQARLEEIRRQAGQALIATEIQGMNEGRSMFKFPEGTRNRPPKGAEENPMQPHQLLPVRAGYSQVVCGVDADKDILIVTVGFFYGIGREKTRTHPTLYVDIPDDQQRTDPEKLTNTISHSLSHGRDQAVLLHSAGAQH